MQIKLKELLENMTAGNAEPVVPEPNQGVVEESVEDGPSVATACPPTPRRVSTIQAAIEAATLDEEARAQADFFDPPPGAERAPEASGKDDEEEELEQQTFTAAMLSPLSRRPPSGIIDPPIKRPRRDSGLIDVRSMAAAYREYDGLAKDKERGPDVKTAPLPILAADELAGPLLLPQPSPPARSLNWLYLVVAALGALVVIGSTAAVTALVVKQRAGGSRNFAALSQEERLALCEAEEAVAAAPAPSSQPEVEEVIAADLPADTAPAAPVPVAAVDDNGDDDDRHRSRSSSRRSKDREEEEDPNADTGAASAPVVSAPAPAVSAPAATDDLAAAAGSATSAVAPDGEKCDEVTCLVSDKGCCGDSAKSGSKRADAPAPDPNLPARPDKAAISAGVAAVQSRLQSCGDRHAVRGAVTVKISIAPAGEVKSATTSQGSAEFQTCLSSALRAARFPASQQGARVSYPVMLK